MIHRSHLVPFKTGKEEERTQGLHGTSVGWPLTKTDTSFRHHGDILTPLGVIIQQEVCSEISTY